MTQILHRLPSVLRRTGDSKSTHYKKIEEGLFTKPVKIGPRASAWPDSEITALINARIAGKTDQEIRHLVKKLETVRKTSQ